jgi:hypothetical protein
MVGGTETPGWSDALIYSVELVEETEKRGMLSPTPRVFCYSRIANRALSTVACPLLMAATGLLLVGSSILTVSLKALPILMPIPSIGVEIMTISLPVLAIGS